MSLTDTYVHFQTRERVASKLDPAVPGSMSPGEITSVLRGLQPWQVEQVAVEALARLGHYRPAAPSEIALAWKSAPKTDEFGKPLGDAPMAAVEGPDQNDVDQLRGLLDLMASFPNNDQRARYLLSSNWMRGKQEQVEIVRRLGRAETEQAAYEAMDAERRTWESRRAVENVALAELQRERDGLRGFQERVLDAAEQWKERGYLYEACGLAVDDLMNGGDGHV